VTTNIATTYTYERLDTNLAAVPPAARDAEPESRLRIPLLIWAGGILFAVNLLILFCVWLSPELRVTMYGEDADHRSAYVRPSPFTETAQLVTTGPLRQPEKVQPASYQEPQLDLTQSAASSPITGERVHQVVESYSDFPRMTARRATPAPHGNRAIIKSLNQFHFLNP
jgi:hypothetical protein